MGPKKSNFFGHFLKDQKMSSYGKNQNKIKEYFGEMGQKDQFWPKTANLGQKNQI